MIIDAYGHLITPPAVFAVQTVLKASNGQHSKEWYLDRGGEELPSLPADPTTFDDALRQPRFDADVHSQRSLELLFKTAGTDRSLFGTERPGSGGAINPKTGRSFEDFKYTIDRIDSLTDADRALIYEQNARIAFPGLNW